MSTAESKDPAARNIQRPLSRRALYSFRSSLHRRGYSGRHLRNRFSYSAALRAASRTEGRSKDLDSAWADLWEAIVNGAEISPEDEAAILACERWRRKAGGERSGLRAVFGRFQQAQKDWHRLTSAIRSGVPSSLRGPAWYACSGAAIKRQKAEVPYSVLIARGHKLNNDAANVIEVDLPRTGVGDDQIVPLRNILLAFASRNPSIGYCQSMNFLAKTLLLYNEEERAFWILCSLLEDILPVGYYTPTMHGLRTDLKLLDSLLVEYLPKLNAHLKKNCIDLSPITMNWFLCLFVNTLPAAESHRVLDCLLHEGPKVVFRTALGILHMRETQLLKAEAVVDAYQLLRAPYGPGPQVHGLVDRDAPPTDQAPMGDLLTIMYGGWLQGLSTDMLRNLRCEHERTIAIEDKAHEAKRAAYRKEQAAKTAETSKEVPDSQTVGCRRDDSFGSSGSVGDEPTPQVPATLELKKIRAESFALAERLPVQRSRLGFAGREADNPKQAASWLSLVTGDQVDVAMAGEGSPASGVPKHLERRSSSMSPQLQKFSPAIAVEPNGRPLFGEDSPAKKDFTDAVTMEGHLPSFEKHGSYFPGLAMMCCQRTLPKKSAPTAEVVPPAAGGCCGVWGIMAFFGCTRSDRNHGRRAGVSRASPETAQRQMHHKSMQQKPLLRLSCASKKAAYGWGTANISPTCGVAGASVARYWAGFLRTICKPRWELDRSMLFEERWEEHKVAKRAEPNSKTGRSFDSGRQTLAKGHLNAFGGGGKAFRMYDRKLKHRDPGG